jgi:hypothetical protein
MKDEDVRMRFRIAERDLIMPLRQLNLRQAVESNYRQGIQGQELIPC